MSLLSREKIEVLKREAKGYDYVRFTWPCIHGIPQGKTVGGRFTDGFLEDGITCFTGAIAMGPGNELINIPEVMDDGCANLYAKPVCDHIRELPWSGDKEIRVGEVLCETVYKDGAVQNQNPRYVARKQIQKLADMGLRIYSSSEMEFMVTEKDTMKPLFSGNDYIKVFSFSKHEKMFFEFDRMLQDSGINIETFQCEYSPGQLEFTLKPSIGIAGPDATFQFKQAMKELCYQKGYHATFMTRPFGTSGCSNGTHFNFSLWNEDNKNAFYDSSKPDNLSDLALHFIGGYLKHVNAVTALCSPTLNCYRRLHTPWSPDLVDWGIDHRFTTHRVKNYSEKETYMENRIASGSSNPYLVMAATIAAGIDGIVNKIQPPVKGKRADAEALPYTLEESLSALKEDTYMVEALGEEFVDWFVMCKEQIDFAKFKDHDVKQSIPEEIEAERKEFFEFM